MGFLDCQECGEYADSVFDHEERCPAAIRIAERQIERLEDNLDTPWETDNTQERLEKYRDFVHTDTES